MFAESSAAAQQAVAMWPAVTAFSVVTAVNIVIIRVLYRRREQSLDEKVAAVEERLKEKVDVNTCEAHLQGIEWRLDDMHEMVAIIYQKLNGGQAYKSPRRTK